MTFTRERLQSRVSLVLFHLDINGSVCFVFHAMSFLYNEFGIIVVGPFK